MHQVLPFFDMCFAGRPFHVLSGAVGFVQRYQVVQVVSVGARHKSGWHIHLLELMLPSVCLHCCSPQALDSRVDASLEPIERWDVCRRQGWPER